MARKPPARDPKTGKIGVPFEKGRSGNPRGRPVGTRDRATIVKEILEAVDKKTGKSFVDLMTEAVLRRAIRGGDPTAFDKLMDSAYGKVKDVTKVEVEGVKVIRDSTLRDPGVLDPLPGEPGHPGAKPDDEAG